MQQAKRNQEDEGVVNIQPNTKQSKSAELNTSVAHSNLKVVGTDTHDKPERNDTSGCANRSIVLREMAYLIWSTKKYFAYEDRRLKNLAYGARVLEISHRYAKG